MAKNTNRRKPKIQKNTKGSLSDRNDNSETICNRKTTKTTTNINSSASSKKSEAHSKQEMQQTDCDIQRDQQFRTTTSKLSNNDNKAKSDDSMSSDTLMSDNNNNEESNSKMHHSNDERIERSIDDEGEQSDSLIENNKREHNNNNSISVSTETFADENANRNGSTKKKVHGESESSRTDKFKCPVCDLKLDSQHTFTIHIRQHNPSDHSHTCRLCGKTLSSASSLDRHMLIHSGERPFKCRICNMAFTTNGNMHRHMRTHGMELNEESNGAADGSNNNNNNNNNSSNTNKLIKSKKRKVSEDGVNDDEAKVSPKRRNSDGGDFSSANLNFGKETEIHCPVCKKSFVSKSALHSHMENHPNDPIYCRDCGMILNNYATYTQHRCTAASIEGTTNLFNTNRMNFSTAPPVGFYDLSFTDFTSRKFSIIAKSFCEDNLRKASSPYHDFECDKCHRAFPCGSALNLHQSTHNGETYCSYSRTDFPTPSLYLSHQMKHGFEYPLSFSHSTIPPPHGFMGPTVGPINGLHNSSYGDVPQSDKEDFLALLDLHNKGSQLSSIQSNYKFIRNEDPFDNASYYIHAKPIPPRPTTFQPKIITNGTDSESGKHDLADIQSIISVTSSATPLISSIRSSPPAASPASPVHLGVSGAQPDSPVAADSANASPNTPSLSSSVKPENEEKQADEESTEDNKEKALSIVVEGEDLTTESYKCNKCTLIFKSSNALKRHNRGHTQGGHSYACHLCPYTSLDKSTLVRHLRTHNGERPFQCAICKYAFTTKANCERHVKKRHKKLQKQEIRSAMQYNPNMSTTSTLSSQNLTKSDSALSLSPSSDGFPGGFDTVCKYCNVDFKFNRVLRHHLRSLHNSCSRKPYCCTVCKLGFSTKNNCIRHVVKQHPDMKDKLSTVVLANATQSLLNSDHSESESLYRDSPEVSSNHANESINMSSDNSLNVSSVETLIPPQNSSLAALCQIAKNISVNSDKPMNLTLEDKDNADDEDTDIGVYEDQPLNLASHSHEDQPLDLAVHALDLSCKSSYSNKESSCEDMKQVNEAVRTAASSLLALRSMAATTVFPNGGLLGTTSLFNQAISLTPPLPAHSSPSVSMMSPNSCTSMEDIYKVTTFRISKNRLMPRNERSFTCIYCSAGFTLKSNMERHIKRKHPEFARPPRTRGGSVAVQQTSQNNSSNASLLSKSNNPTLSSKTRAALRVVLSNKVMGSSTGIQNNSRPSSPAELVPNNLTTKIIEDNSNNGIDNNGGDLASVSSLIDHSANSSNALKQYFNKQNEDMDSNVGEVITGETKTNETIRPNISKSGKSSAKRRGKEANKMNTGVVTKKRSAYTDSPNSVSCPYCARKFPWTSSLRRHILTHTGLKPYKCPKCPILFTTKSNCERHLLRKHNGREKRNIVEQPVIPQDNKPFKCNVCPHSTFTTQGNLRKHYYLRHWTKTGKANNAHKDKKGDKPEEETNATNTNIPVDEEETDDRLNFKCYLCEMCFNGRLKCLSHLQSCHSNEYEILQSKGAVDKVPATDTKLLLDNHNDDYEPYGQEKIFCVFCPRQFMSLENLRRHMRVHLGDRPFKCMLCTKKFSLKNSLLRHHRTNHPESVLSAKGKGKSKQIISPTTQSMSLIKETESQTSSKAVKPKGSCNSLLYLIPKDKVKQSETYAQITSTSYNDIGDGSDLIQNLLGIQDSKMIDEMLDSADSAARILGVKDAL